MLYTDADILLCNSVVLKFATPPGAPNFVIANQPQPQEIAFQFPPKILSDNRKAQWQEGELPGNEPVATYVKSGAREITFTATYIIDGQSWTAERISTIVRDLRGYFSRTSDANRLGWRNLIVYFKMWRHGGEREMSCRIGSVNVKHSETVVLPCTASVGVPLTTSPGNIDAVRAAMAYPLRTDITIDLKLWTKGGPIKAQNLAGLVTEETPDWY